MKEAKNVEDKNNEKLNEDDENDPVVNEIDVYLSRTLSNNIYVLQVNIITYFCII
jgi:hypothetical protein